MASREKFVVILIILLVILLFGGTVIGWFYWKNSDDQPEIAVDNANKAATDDTNSTSAENSNNINKSVENTTIEPASPLDVQDFLMQLARNFAERYGSFSNQNNFENILDLKLYMTEDMQEEADAFIAKNKTSDANSQEYYGITTKALTLAEISYDPAGGKAIYEVGAQRQESQGASGQGRVFKQSCLIEFKEVDGEWKVQQFIWK